EAAELLASRPAWPLRASLLVASLLVIGAVVWAAFAPIEAVLVARGSLARAPLVAEARISAADADRVKPGQRARVSLGWVGRPAGTTAGVVSRIEGPVADADRGLAFVAVIALEDPFIVVGGERRPLAPGPGVTVEVATGETTPLAWLVGAAASR